MYLFIGVDSQEVDKSINHQLANSESSFILVAQQTDANINNYEETGKNNQGQSIKINFCFPGDLHFN